jgi:hypothetical protein
MGQVCRTNEIRNVYSIRGGSNYKWKKPLGTHVLMKEDNIKLDL